jgi:PAS domain S-box-containing protein
MGAKNTKGENKPNQWAIISLVFTTLAALTISTYFFFTGWFIVHQNLFYIPIVISCMFFGRKGFVFSVILAFTYLLLILYFTNDFTIIWQAIARVCVFSIIAGIITFLSINRRQAEDKLRQAHAQLKSVINSSSQVSIISTDLSGRIVTFNSGAERMLGYSAQEMMDKTPVFYHLESEMKARGRELTKELGYPVEGFDVLVAYAKKGKYEEREWTYIKKDGGRLIVNLVVTPVRDDADRIIGFLGIANDITERKRLEDELRENMHSLEVFHEVAVGRELKMIELKDKIAELEAQLVKK